MAIRLLAPDIQKMLLQGKEAPHITPEMLTSWDLPMDWDKQRESFGVASVSALVSFSNLVANHSFSPIE